MAQVIQASELTLHDVEEKFLLQQVEDEQFFGEWQEKLPELTADQKEWLDQVKANFLALEKYPVHEEIVKMVVLSPLLSLAGLFRYPFRPVAEKQVELVTATAHAQESFVASSDSPRITFGSSVVSVLNC
jgi:hypothetical protein